MCPDCDCALLPQQISAFRDITIDKNHAVRLEVFDIVLGVLYMVIVVIEAFGLLAAFLVRVSVHSDIHLIS